MARYGKPVKSLTRAQVQDFVTLDYDARMALGAFERKGRASRLLGVARWDHLVAQEGALVNLTIHDDFQGRGIGSFLIRLLARHARRAGVKKMITEYAASATRMEAMAKATGARVERGPTGKSRAVWDLTPDSVRAS